MNTTFTSNLYEGPANNLGIRDFANTVYNESRGKAGFSWLIGLITGKKCMPSLAGRMKQHTLVRQTPVGLRTVEIDSIVGSESRADDFDSKFYPLNDRSRERWVSIASLRLCEVGLPAVDLLQVGQEYFVRDGHHRISVARALGEAFIEAHVITIELE